MNKLKEAKRQQPASTPAQAERVATQATADEFDQLRDVLLHDERRAIAELQQQLTPESRMPAVAQVLAASMREADSRHGPALIDAMRTPVVEAISISARRDHERLSEALAPVIGPAIVRAVSEILKRYTQSIEAVARNNLTLAGLKWRMEARRTGLPFSEVVLKHTLLYRVEQIFLIHKSSGLLVAHAAHPELESNDNKDAIAGMMSAIHSFAQDSLIANRADQLQTVDLGGRVLRLTQGPHAMIASVHRGNAPRTFFDRVHQTLEEIHRQYHHELRAFDGSNQALASTQSLLEPLLLEDTLESKPPTGKSNGRRIVWISALIFVLAAWGVAQWIQQSALARLAAAQQQQQMQRLRAQQEAAAALEREHARLSRVFDAMPGLVVTRLEKLGDRWSLRGLGDPFGPTPQEIALAASLPEASLQLHLRPFLSLEPEIMLKRVGRVLEPPATVTVTVAGSKLIVAGAATQAWINRARYHLKAHLPYFTDSDLSNLRPITELDNEPQQQ